MLQVYRESMAKLLVAVRAPETALPHVDDSWDERDNELKKPLEDAVNDKLQEANGLEMMIRAKEDAVNSKQTGNDLADTLLANFLQSENDNYTIFSYVSGINNEVGNIFGKDMLTKHEIGDEIYWTKSSVYFFHFLFWKTLY